MEGTKYKTKEDVLRRAREIIGIPLKNIDSTGRLSTGKGAIGTVIEESWYGYLPNSQSEPDFPEAGVELKVTPYVKASTGVRAKERLVCNIINYMEEYKHTFYTSSFWHKCNTMLLMSYEHKNDVNKGEYTIDEAVLFSFPEEDLTIIEQDWEMIITKIRNGQAHLISEADTFYLAACTKGANSSSTRPQPFSDIPAMQRAYSLKSSYMTQILNTYIFGTTQSEHIVKDLGVLTKTTFEQYVENLLKPYYGKSISELKQMFNIDNAAKNIVELLISRLLGIKGHINQTEEFTKANIELKTIRLETNGIPKESMSFEYFDFNQLISTTWEESDIYNTFATKKFMFVIFQRNYAYNDKDIHEKLGYVGVTYSDKNHNSYPIGLTEYRFKKILFWNMPYEDLENVHDVWQRTVDTIRRGVKLIPTEQGIKNDLPKSTENPVAHVRPHGRDSHDTLSLPDGRRMTKQSFWLNRKYIADQVK